MLEFFSGFDTAWEGWSLTVFWWWHGINVLWRTVTVSGLDVHVHKSDNFKNYLTEFIFVTSYYFITSCLIKVPNVS